MMPGKASTKHFHGYDSLKYSVMITARPEFQFSKESWHHCRILLISRNIYIGGDDLCLSAFMKSDKIDQPGKRCCLY